MPQSEVNRRKITIQKNGPYLVTGSVPLSEKRIVSNGQNNEYHSVREFPLQEEYALCRCGHTKNPPYCDGSHVKVGFIGDETASRSLYAERAELLEGPELDLLDDNRCAYARFCHRKEGSAWEMTENSDDPNVKKEAILAACDCPSGRLVALDKNGKTMEPDFEPSIEILQDMGENVRGPIFVKGCIPILSSDGFVYEERNRVTLCRCGESSHKPFCDASHVSSNFSDMN